MTGTRRVFYLGLNMAGAVSAGAYTAGVLDFLIDALDTLYEKRQEQAAKYGDDFSRWEIPAHEVRLVVMAGASAGGMNAAIAAASLCEPFTPVRAPMPKSPPNRLYKAWVEDIDISYLLGVEDLVHAKAPVISLLDSTQIDRIAADTLRVTSPLAAKRPYVADNLKLVYTLTNLGGIPYAIEAGDGNDETQTLYNADQANFEVRWDGGAAESQALTLSPGSNANWPALAEVAKATGAFPIALAPRLLKRTTTMYNRRLWKFSQGEPGMVNGHCQCSRFEELPPNWKFGDGVEFSTLNVDGGVTNNDPFECARQELLRQQPVQDPEHNPRSGEEADRAVISIAPFLSTPNYDLDHPPPQSLPSVIGALLAALVNQSRMQGENLKLTSDPRVYSRWAISPSIDETTRNALASASVGAFGGFLAKEFRDHDYQLGRRNCQWFLKRHFGVPLTNVVMRDYAPRQELLPQFGMTMEDGSQGIALIPLLGALNDEIPEVDVKISQHRLPPIVEAACGRLKLVASRLLLANDATLLKVLGLEAGWLATRGSVKAALIRQLGYGLARQNLIE